MLDEEVGEEEEVCSAVFQFGHIDGELVDAVEEVFAELSLSHSLCQVFVGGAHQSDIDVDFLSSSHGSYLSLLQGTKQLHLHIIAQVSHLVEEECSSVGYFESSLLVLFGSSKGAFHMTEEFGCRYISWYGSTVYGEEGLVGTAAQFVYAMRHIFLACAACSEYQYRHRGGCYE